MKKTFSRRAEGRAQGAGGFSALLFCACRAALIAVAVGVLLFFAATAIAFAQEDPNALVMPLGYAAAALTVCFAGFLAARFTGRRVLLSGLLTAACLLFLYTLLSFLPQLAARVPMPIGISLGLHAVVVPVALLGAYLGRPRLRTGARRR